MHALWRATCRFDDVYRVVSKSNLLSVTWLEMGGGNAQAECSIYSRFCTCELCRICNSKQGSLFVLEHFQRRIPNGKSLVQNLRHVVTAGQYARLR